MDAGDPRLAAELADRAPVQHLVLAASGGGVGPFTPAVGDGAQGELEAKVLARTSFTTGVVIPVDGGAHLTRR